MPSLLRTHRDLILLFAAALCLRGFIPLVYDAPLVGDAKEYYVNSQTLENTVGLFPYEHWYQRTPAYMAFLHVTHQSLALQILLSTLTCVLLELLYRRGGWVLAFYPPGIMYANVYMKETLLVFLFVLAAWLLRDRKRWLLVALPLIFTGFISYGGVWEYNEAFAAGQRSLIHRLYILWRPDYHFFILIPHPPQWLESLLRGTFVLAYVPVLFLFLRRIRWQDYELWIVAGISLLSVFSFGNERFREPAMPFVLGFVTPIVIDIAKTGWARLNTLITPER